METTTPHRRLVSLAECPSAAFALKYCNTEHRDLTCEVEDRLPGKLLHCEQLHGVLYDQASGALLIGGEREAFVNYPPSVDAEGPIARCVTGRGDAERFTVTAEGGRITVRETYDLRCTFKPSTQDTEDTRRVLPAVVEHAIKMIAQSRWTGLDEAMDALRADIALRELVQNLCTALAPHGFSAELDLLGEEIDFLDADGEFVDIDDLPPHVRALVESIDPRAKDE